MSPEGGNACPTASVCEVRGVGTKVSVRREPDSSRARRRAAPPTACLGSNLTTEALTTGLGRGCTRRRPTPQKASASGSADPAGVSGAGAGLAAAIATAWRSQGGRDGRASTTTGSRGRRAPAPASHTEATT